MPIAAGKPGYYVIPGFNGRYWITTYGQIWSVVSNAPIKPYQRSSGYYYANLSNGIKKITKAVHQLVTLTFIGPCPAGEQVRHWDGDNTNNYYRNLLYGTSQENMDDQRRHGTWMHGEKVYTAKLNSKKVYSLLVDFYVRHATMAQLELKYQISGSTISSIRHGRLWKEVFKQFIKKYPEHDPTTVTLHKGKTSTSPEELIEQALALLTNPAKGQTLTSIARELGVARMTLKYRARKAGLIP